MGEPVWLRERKKSETRQAISAAALDLAVTHGPAAITVYDIAAAANVSCRTVFNYFPNKEAAILGVDPDRRNELLERLERRPADEPPLTAFLSASQGFFTHDIAVLWRTRAQLARDHSQLHSAYLASFSTFEEDLTDAIARRVGVDPAVDPYPRLLVAVATTAMRVAVGHALEEHRHLTIAESMAATFAVVAACLPAPPPTIPPTDAGN